MRHPSRFGRAGREGRRAGAGAQVSAPPYITRKIPVFEVLDEEGLQLIEDNAETILEEIGIEFRDMPEALEILKNGGAEIGERAFNTAFSIIFSTICGDRY